ncbi:MAG: tetratricopeptide repeat protein [Phycisphaerae bacterium]|nr:tetratricopeptide repeat protein [Phycisphaerae bacterium]
MKLYRYYTLLWFLGVVLSGICLDGCQEGVGRIDHDEQVSDPPGKNVVDEEQRYGRVPAELMTPGLQLRQYEDMLVKLENVDYPDVTQVVLDGIKERVEPAGEISGEDRLEAEKAIVRGRWLLKDISGNNHDQALYEKVIQQAQNGLKHDPGNGRLYELLARGHLGLGNEQDGRQAAYQAVLLEPNNYKGWQYLGEIALGNGNHLLAGGFFSKALSSPQATEDNPVSLILKMQLAGALSNGGFLTAACDHYRSAWNLLIEQRNYGQANNTAGQLAGRPHVPILIMAQLHLRMGHMDQCVTLLREAQAILDGQEEDMFQSFVMSLLQQSIRLKTRYDQVTALCRYGISVSDDASDILKTFYDATQKMAKYKAYLVEIEQWHAPQSGPILNDRLYALGLALADENAKAEEILNNLASQDNIDPLVYRDLGALYAKTGQWQKMLVAHSRHMQLDEPHLPDILRSLEGHLESIEDWETSFEQWRTEPALNESCVGNYLLGHLADKHHKTKLAEDYYRKALAIAPAFRNGRAGLIEILLERGDYKEALEWIEGDHSSESTHKDMTPEMLRFAGRAFSGLGQYDRAADHYRQLITRDKNHNGAYLDLARVMQHQGNYEPAESILLRVLANQPDSLNVYHHLIVLYARWEANKVADDSIRINAITRGRKMTRLFLDIQSKSPREAANLKREALVRDVMKIVEAHPKAQAAAFVLSDLYVAEDQVKKAVSEMERLLAMFPDNDRILLRAAQLNEKQGAFKASARHRLQRYKMNPDDPDRLRAALSAMRYADQSPEALALLLERLKDESFRRDLKVIKTLEAEAVRLFVINREYQQAVRLFQEWYERVKNPTDKEKPASEEQIATMGSNLVWALTDAGDYDKAAAETVTLFSRDRDIAPQQVALANWLSRTLNIRMRFEASLSLLEKILAIRPDQSGIRLQIYTTLIDQGRSAEAIEKARQWHLASPDDRKRRNSYLLTLQATGDFQAAAQQQREFIKTDPQNDTMRIQLANILINTGQEKNLNEAEVILEELQDNKQLLSQWFDARVTLDLVNGQWKRALDRIEKLPLPADSPYRPQLKVRVLTLAGQTGQALEQQKAIVESDPNDIMARLQYSVLLDRIGKIDESINELEAILREYPDNPAIKNNLAYSLTENHKNTDRAYQLLRESLLNDPKSTPTLDSLGWFYYKKGDFLPALVYIYQSAASMAMPDAEILNHLGDILYRLGRKKEAGVFWQRALDDLARRIKNEIWLKKELEHTQKKLRQLNENQPIDVAPIFNEATTR